MSSLSRGVLLGLFTMTLLALFSIFAAGEASAAANNNGNIIRDDVETALRTCDSSPHASSQAAYITPTGDPNGYSPIIPYGASTVQADIHFVVYICNNSAGRDASGNVDPSRAGTNYEINSITVNSGGTLTGLSVGNEFPVNYAPPLTWSNNEFHVVTRTVTYNFGGPVYANQWIDFNVTDKKVNAVRNAAGTAVARYECVTASPPYPANSGVPSNFSDHAPCNSLGGANFQSFVIVDQPTYESSCDAVDFTSGISTISGTNYIEPGKTFTAEVTFTNTGSGAWSSANSFKLGSQTPQDNANWQPLSPTPNGSTRVPLPKNVGEDESVTFTFTATAPSISPSAPTKYDFDWRMVQEGVRWFGETCEADIYVAEKYDIKSPTNGTSTSSTFVPGTSFTWTVNFEVPNDDNGDSNDADGDGVPDILNSTNGFRYTVNGVVNNLLSTPTSSGNIDMNILGDDEKSLTAEVTVPAAVAVSLGDTICMQARARQIAGWEGGPVTNTGYTSWATLACITAAEKGFLTIPNGSAWAGGNYNTLSNTGYGGGLCAVPGGRSNGFIESVTKGNVGAFASYDVGATSNITSFGSVGPALNRLMFANTPSNGEFSSDGKCITDLWKYLSKDKNLDGITEIGNVFPAGPNRVQQYYRPGNLTISSAQTITAGERITLLVDGDVNIGANITYENYNVNDPANIPIIIIIARGDINIASDVTELHGVYMARPKDGEILNHNPIKGQIDTCAYSVNAATNPASPTSGSNNGRLSSNVCRNQLRVRGMLIANDIEFRRTYGGIGGTNTNGGLSPAEIIEGNPEVYLARPFFVSTFEPNLPINSLKDLPPVVY